MSEDLVLDLVSAVDSLGDIESYLHKCETESLLCDIQYIKGKVADVMFDLNSMMERLCKDTR